MKSEYINIIKFKEKLKRDLIKLLFESKFHTNSNSEIYLYVGPLSVNKKKLNYT